MIATGVITAHRTYENINKKCEMKKIKLYKYKNLCNFKCKPINLVITLEDILRKEKKYTNDDVNNNNISFYNNYMNKIKLDEKYVTTKCSPSDSYCGEYKICMSKRTKPKEFSFILKNTFINNNTINTKNIISNMTITNITITASSSNRNITFLSSSFQLVVVNNNNDSLIEVYDYFKLNTTEDVQCYCKCRDKNKKIPIY